MKLDWTSGAAASMVSASVFSALVRFSLSVSSVCVVSVPSVPTMSNATSVRASGIVAPPGSSPLPFGVMFRNFSPSRLFTSTLARVERPRVAFLTSKSAITFSGTDPQLVHPAHPDAGDLDLAAGAQTAGVGQLGVDTSCRGSPGTSAG